MKTLSDWLNTFDNAKIRCGIYHSLLMSKGKKNYGTHWLYTVYAHMYINSVIQNYDSSY